MQNDDGIENALENKNYSFSSFCMNEFFCLKDVVDPKVSINAMCHVYVRYV